MLHKTLLILLILACTGTVLQAQSILSGTVTDTSGMPLAFVTVAVEGNTTTGVFTGIEGRFSVQIPPGTQSVSFRYVGFNTLRFTPDQWPAASPWQVVMTPAAFELQEAVVRAGENPADILMRKVIAGRNRNNPEKQSGYTCKTYNKMVFDLLPHREAFDKIIAKKDSTEKEVRESIQSFNSLEKNAGIRHVFLIESVTERSFRTPNLVRERVLLNRVSGTDYAGLVALANAVQPFTFYGDYLQIIDKDFVNPISPGSPELYFFALEDTLYTGTDTVWTVSFHPRKEKVFTALKGTLHIHSDGYALQNVRAWPADTGTMSIKIEQSYRRIEQRSSAEGETGGQQWFPEQLNFELTLPKYPAPHLGMKAVGRSFVTDVTPDSVLQLQRFNPEQALVMEESANNRSDSVWRPWRALAPLSDKEWHTYAWLDSLGQEKNFNRYYKLLDYASTGLIPLAGPVNLDLRKVIVLNDYENVRLGIGLSTGQPRPLGLSRRLEISAYAGYGFRDKSLKYGAQALWRIHRGFQTRLSAGWRHDLTEPGTLYMLEKEALVDRFLYAKKVDQIRESWVTLGSKVWKSAAIRLDFRQQQIKPLYPYSFGPAGNTVSGDFNFTEATVFFRLAHNEERRRFLGGDAGTVNHWPAIELAYTRGLKGVLNGGYAYDRLVMAVYQSVFIRRLGRCSWRVEAGQVDADAPLAKLFTLNQSPDDYGLSFLSVRNTFQSLPDTLFASDRFVNLYLTQELGPVLYRRKYSAPFLSLHHNMSWGQLSRAELHQETGLDTVEKALQESGVQLDNLAMVNYFNFARLGLGGAVYYRWGGLQADHWQDNLSFRLSLKLNL